MVNKQILVTGGAGFIGSFLVDELIRKGHKVRVFDNLDPQVHSHGIRPEYLSKEAEFIDGDVRDYEALEVALRGVDIVFHKASAVGIGQSHYEIKRYVDVNTGGTANLLDIIVNKKCDIEKLVVAASMSSYGEGAYLCNLCGRVRPELRSLDQLTQRDWEFHCPTCNAYLRPVPTMESDEQRSTSVYAITKKNQEELSMTVGKTYDIPVVALRYFNVYGPRQSLNNPYTGVTAIFMSRLKNNNQPVIYEDGKQTRDFISVHDIVDINMRVMEDGKADYQTFNVGTGHPLSISDIASTIARLCGKETNPVIAQEFRKRDVRHCFADISKIKKILGFEPRITFEDGMRGLIEWAQDVSADDLFEKASAELHEKGIL